MSRAPPDDDVLDRIGRLERELAELRESVAPRRQALELPQGLLSWLTVSAGPQQLGLFLPAVQEVIRMVRLAPVPNAPAWLAGVLNLRGALLPVLDLRVRVGAPAALTEQTPLVILNDGQRRGVIVDAVGDVLHIRHDVIEPARAVPGTPEMGLGWLRDAHGPVVLLDHTRLLPLKDELTVETLVAPVVAAEAP